MTKMAKTDTLFMTKTTAKPCTLWDRTYLYSPYKVVAPSPGDATITHKSNRSVSKY